ncbi:MAG: mannonate dehydratase [Opitutaceae bacterium]|jgi:mannonate dehydratase|nr:mannonate dehydratase [Opitutaceae bacterium]
MSPKKEQFLEEGFRWFGPADPVPLAFIRQSGAESVFTSLHEIPYGAPWPEAAVAARRRLVENAGLRWAAVESVPVSEAVRTRSGPFARHIENYRATLRALAAQGVRLVIYNFMPVLDWIRTDLRFRLPDGSACLRYDPAQFAAFEIGLLKRPGAERDYTPDQLARARAFLASLNESRRAAFERSIIDVFPGCSLGLGLPDIRRMIDAYRDITPDGLREHLRLFLQAVAPVAQECGLRLAIHPDDPPFPVLGLPRIASNLSDFLKILSWHDGDANGVCFCTGSLGASPDNDLPAMLDALAHRVFVAHLRSTQREPGGAFHESGHLEGSVPMFAIVRRLLALQHQRLAAGGPRLLFRPDHGRDMADDLDKPPPPNPGYAFIGRMKGLAELRGLQAGILGSQSAAA